MTGSLQDVDKAIVISNADMPLQRLWKGTLVTVCIRGGI